MRIESLPPLPPRPEEGHKGTFGTLLIVGGSREMIGAPMLAARAAYRAGCGLVRVAMPVGVLAPALTLVPEATGLGLCGDGEDVGRLCKAMEKADAVVVGPGLSSEPAGEPLLREIYTRDRPCVIDADGLNLLAARDAWPGDFAAPAVLTPHPGEMKRLLKHLGRNKVPSDDAGRADLARHAAATLGKVVLLKGRRTVISDGERVFVNHTGGVALAKAGTGDVLSGLIGSLLAQGMSPYDAAVRGAYHHGLAGEAAARALGNRAVLAMDVAERVGGTMG